MSQGSASLRWCWVDNFLIEVMNDRRPSIQDWDLLIDDIEKNRGRIKGALVFSYGGGPGSVQRAKLRAVIEKGEIYPAAILSDSILAHGVVSAFSLFLKEKVRAFSPTELEEGLRYLKIPPHLWLEVKQTLEKLRQEVKSKSR